MFTIAQIFIAGSLLFGAAVLAYFVTRIFNRMHGRSIEELDDEYLR